MGINYDSVRGMFQLLSNECAKTNIVPASKAAQKQLSALSAECGLHFESGNHQSTCSYNLRISAYHARLHQTAKLVGSATGIYLIFFFVVINLSPHSAMFMAKA